MTSTMPRLMGARKLMRFVSIYGPARTLFKAAGRLRVRIPRLGLGRSAPDIAVIGCGQFAYANIAYFLRRKYGPRMSACYDTNPANSRSFAAAHGVGRVCESVEELLATPGLRTVYIASNHASHSPYAVAALERGLDVFVEKPIAVSPEQLLSLMRVLRQSRSRIFAGYNRPFAGAMRELRALASVDPGAGITLSCFVAGHYLAADHWYRVPEEGTRVCGNLGHWLDLLIHVLAWRSLPNRLDIALSWADPDERDDNMSVTIASDRADLFSVMLSSRAEPFEGINETINFQHGETICKIDDFRRMTLWLGPRLIRRRYWPKDVGHHLAILQPFRSEPQRDWREVVLSTLLMLHITDMVRAGITRSVFSLAESWSRLSSEIETT